jgi:hypothetical protein
MRRTSATVFMVRTLVGDPDNRLPGGDAVDEKPESESEPFARVVGEHRLVVGQLGARSVPLQSRLFVGGEAKDVVNDGTGGQVSVCGRDARIGRGVPQMGHDPRHRLRLTCREAGGDELGAVGVRQQGVPQPTADTRDPLLPIAGRLADGFEYPVGDRAEKLLLVREMPVQGTGGDIELTAQPAHRQIGESVVVEDRRRRIHHIAFVQLHTATIT